MKIDKSYIIAAAVAAIFIVGLSYSMANPVINILSTCEDRGWDGSEYNTGVTEMKIGEDFGEDIIVKCNKDPKVTDTMIDVLDALPLIKIRQDRYGEKHDE